MLELIWLPGRMLIIICKVEFTSTALAKLGSAQESILQEQKILRPERVCQEAGSEYCVYIVAVQDDEICRPPYDVAITIKGSAAFQLLPFQTLQFTSYNPDNCKLSAEALNELGAYIETGP